MKAAICTKFGGPEVIEIREIEKPIPKNNEVLIKIGATTVTTYDCWVRGFKLSSRLIALLFGMNFGLKSPKNPILGTELAGEIEAIGEQVQNFKTGDIVFGYPGMSIGSCAEYRSMEADGVLEIKPNNMTIEEAASVQQGALTALYYLRQVNVNKNHKVLVFGASGGVGIYAVQLAKYFGSEVTAVCSTSKIDLVTSIGADHVIDYTKEDFSQSGIKYDIIFDTIGKSPFSASVKAIRESGYYLITTHKLPRFFRIVWQNLTSTKKVISPLLKETKQDLIYLKELIETGKLKAIIDKTFSLEETVEAHKYVESGEKKGHVVIKMN
jgi:NADPH:quinone reductase-like Zn-dependent oxidoreductase